MGANGRARFPACATGVHSGPWARTPVRQRPPLPSTVEVRPPEALKTPARPSTTPGQVRPTAAGRLRATAAMGSSTMPAPRSRWMPAPRSRWMPGGRAAMASMAVGSTMPVMSARMQDQTIHRALVAASLAFLLAERSVGKSWCVRRYTRGGLASASIPAPRPVRPALRAAAASISRWMGMRSLPARPRLVRATRATLRRCRSVPTAAFAWKIPSRLGGPPAGCPARVPREPPVTPARAGRASASYSIAKAVLAFAARPLASATPVRRSTRHGSVPARRVATPPVRLRRKRQRRASVDTDVRRAPSAAPRRCVSARPMACAGRRPDFHRARSVRFL